MKRILSFAFAALLLMGLFSVSFAENEYTNPDMGLSFSTPDGWKLLNREELATLLGDAAEVIDDEEVLELFEVGQQKIVLYATNLTDGSTLSIIAEKHGRDFMDAFKLISDEEFLQEIIASVIGQYEELGFPVVGPTYLELPFSADPSQKHLAAAITITFNGIDMMIIQFLEKGEETAYTISICATTLESTDAAIAAFSPIS